MERIVSLLVAAIYSAFSGIGFTLPKEDNFFFNSDGANYYFQVEQNTSDVHYKSLYQQVHGFEWSDAELCDTTRRQDDTRKGEWPTVCELGLADVDAWSDALNIYSPVAPSDKVEMSSEKNSITWKVKEDVTEDINICAPAAGKINTSHYACNYGSHMEYVISQLNGTEFVLTIDGAKCWYCCAGKKVPDDGRYSATTTDSLKGKSMSAGDVLCVAKAGTVITLERHVSSS